MARGGIKGRLGRTFLLQAAAIGVATVVGIYVAGLILEEILITQALNREARHFWERRGADPAFPLPDTDNLTGYLTAGGDTGALPAPLRRLGPGLHDVDDAPGFSTVHVSGRGDLRLYLVFDGEQVGKLATWFGLVPLALVLVVLYLSIWLAYRFAQRAVSPFTTLAERVDALDPDSPDPEAFHLDDVHADDDEVRVLSTALAEFARRLQAFVNRERHFTRDASHELRTPLTVIGIAADTLLARADTTDAVKRDVQRIRRSVRDMEELVEAFLLLARESERRPNSEEASVNEVVDDEIERLRPLLADKPVEIHRRSDCVLLVDAPARVLAIMLGNLLRNAVHYTDSGSVDVYVDAGGVTIEDSGVGMAAEDVEQAFELFFRADGGRGGHGIGLSIVRRLSDRFDWPVRITSTPGVGTRVRVEFPAARTLSADTG